MALTLDQTGAVIPNAQLQPEELEVVNVTATRPQPVNWQQVVVALGIGIAALWLSGEFDKPKRRR